MDNFMHVFKTKIPGAEMRSTILRFVHRWFCTGSPKRVSSNIANMVCNAQFTLLLNVPNIQWGAMEEMVATR